MSSYKFSVPVLKDSQQWQWQSGSSTFDTRPTVTIRIKILERTRKINLTVVIFVIRCDLWLYMISPMFDTDFSPLPCTQIRSIFYFFNCKMTTFPLWAVFPSIILGIFVGSLIIYFEDQSICVCRIITVHIKLNLQKFMNNKHI